MACLFDARDWLEWSTITLEAVYSGSFSYVNGASHTISGTMGGATTLTLNRATAAYDAQAAPTLAAQTVGEDEFKSYRECHGCPVVLVHFQPDLDASGDVTISITDTPPSDPPSTVTGSGAGRFAIALGSVSGCDCGDPETTITTLSVSIPDLVGVEVFDVGADAVLTSAALDWAGGTYTETVAIDLLNPDDGVTVIGSQSIAFTVTAAV